MIARTVTRRVDLRVEKFIPALAFVSLAFASRGFGPAVPRVGRPCFLPEATTRTVCLTPAPSGFDVQPPPKNCRVRRGLVFDGGRAVRGCAGDDRPEPWLCPVDVEFWNSPASNSADRNAR